MTKIGTITFHASHNYGSALQAFAFQEFVNLNFKDKAAFEIINLQTIKQQDMYRSIFEQKNLPIQRKLKKLFLYKYKKQLINQKNIFQDFNKNYLNSGKEYNSLDDLKRDKNLKYDKYIVGSDQVWNFNSRIKDFDWSYLLEFTKSTNKYSYAVSCGNISENHDIKKFNRFFRDLQQFRSVSVRETDTLKYIQDNSNVKPELHIDPTLLLTKDNWNKYLNKSRIVKEKYIFLYHFNCTKTIKLAKKISNELDLPIVIVKEPHKLEFSNKFIKKLDCTPFDFIQLIRDSEICVSQSYHALIFSLLFNVPIIQVGATLDNRIVSLLKMLKLNPLQFDLSSAKKAFEENTKRKYKEIQKLISAEQTKSLNYLREIIYK